MWNDDQMLWRAEEARKLNTIVISPGQGKLAIKGHSLPIQNPVVHDDTFFVAVKYLLNILPERFIIHADIDMLRLFCSTGLIKHSRTDTILRHS